LQNILSKICSYTH